MILRIVATGPSQPSGIVAASYPGLAKRSPFYWGPNVICQRPSRLTRRRSHHHYLALTRHIPVAGHFHAGGAQVGRVLLCTCATSRGTALDTYFGVGPKREIDKIGAPWPRWRSTTYLLITRRQPWTLSVTTVMSANVLLQPGGKHMTSSTNDRLWQVPNLGGKGGWAPYSSSIG
ncbi:hypothetical protein LZ30DRAFT_703253, partial [Colletotrichum cereale]